MFAQEMTQKIQYSSITERIQLIELLLHSLKRDLLDQKRHKVAHKPFVVRTFNLGANVQLDREEMYLERGL